MQDLMRKHRKAILFFILLFIAVPFVFVFGMPSWTGSKKDRMQPNTIAVIGGVPISEADFRKNLDAAASMQARGKDTRPTYKELDESGVAQRVLEQMRDSALIALQEQARGFDVDQSLLEELMKKDPNFQDEEGNFDPKSWNAWVAGMNKQKQNWNDVYNDLRPRITRQVYLQSVLSASNRVLDKDIEAELLENHTKLQVKYVQVTPPVTPTEEDIQKQYDENKDKYKNPDEKVAEFVAVSLRADVPQLALELVKQAREGADFAALADEHSTLKTKNGGEMPGWQKPRENEVDYRKPLFTLAVGEVSEPIATGPESFAIYKVEEERTNEETGVREVRARQILLKAALSEEERAERQALAEKVSTKAKDSDLESAASEAGLEVQRTGAFTVKSSSIENIPNMDMFAFRKAVDAQTEDTLYDVIEARNNLYVAKVVQVNVGTVPPLAEVREAVEKDAIAALKQKDEYKEEVSKYCDKIKAEATSLAQAVERFPELEMKVKETKEFTRKDYLWQEGIYLQPAQIFGMLGDKEAGAMDGPLRDFRGDSFFVELVKKTPPTEEEKKDWDEERKQLRENALRMTQSDLLEDYRQYLRETVLPTVDSRVDQQTINKILGRDVEKKAEETPDAETGAADGGAADEAKEATETETATQ